MEVGPDRSVTETETLNVHLAYFIAVKHLNLAYINKCFLFVCRRRVGEHFYLGERVLFLIFFLFYFFIQPAL